MPPRPITGIISLAHRYRLPNVFAFRYYPAKGGLAVRKLSADAGAVVSDSIDRAVEVI